MKNMEIALESAENSEGGPRSKGGWKTMPFIVVNEAFERVATVGLHVNIVIYLKTQYHLDNATAASLIFWWGAIAQFLPILGAVLSDSYLGRFRVILLGALASLLGQGMLWLTALLKQARPPHCDHYPHNCVKPSASQLLLLISAFVLMSIGTGGIRPCSLAFGADQLDERKPNRQRMLQSYFSWYYASVAVSGLFAITVLVYIQTVRGWVVGFGVPVGIMLLSTVVFLLGSPLYLKPKADKSLVIGLVQVISVSWKNRNIALPPNHSEGWYHHDKDSTLTSPTEILRFFNKACIIRSPENDLKPDATSSSPWKLCTVQQVENFKSLIKVLPIWSTSIIIGVIISQHSFPVLQATTMDRRFIGNFKIPAATFSAFSVITLGLWVAIYDRIVVPILSKHTKLKRGLTLEQRIGTGLFISCIATATAALVERKRRKEAVLEGLLENPVGIVKMSAFWLVPQYSLLGLSEAFNAIGQIEYYHSKFPKSMASVAIALFAMGFSFANLLGSLIVQVTNRVTERGGRISWLSNNLNKGRYDYYYWVLCVLGVGNFLYFVALRFFSDCYGDVKVEEEEDDVRVEVVESSISPKNLSPIHHVL